MKRPSLFNQDVTKPRQPELSSEVSYRRKVSAPRPPSREGKRVLTLYLDPMGWKQLRLMALEHGTSTQELGVEALNDFFAKHKLNRSA